MFLDGGAHAFSIGATTRLRIVTMLNEVTTAVYAYVYDMRGQSTLPRREAADLAWASKIPMLACAPQLLYVRATYIRRGAHGNASRSRIAVIEAHHTEPS